MKKIWKNIKNISKSKRFQWIFSIIMVVVTVIAVVLNLTGVYLLEENQLLSIIVIFLCGIAIFYVLDEIDFFEEIKGSINKLPDDVKKVGNAFFEETKSELSKIKEVTKNIESELVEVQKCVKDKNTTKGVIIGRRKLEKSKNLDEVWNGADEICLLAIANTSFLRGNGISKLKEAVNRGTKFKLVSLHPEFDAIREYKNSGILSSTSLPLGQNVDDYISNCIKSGDGRKSRRRETKDFKDMVELRLTTYQLPYSMMIVKKQGKVRTIKVDLYGLDMDYLDRRSFYIPVDDEDNIKFYEEQWNTVWNDTQRTTAVDMSKTYRS